jgi:hypothetical protein
MDVENNSIISQDTVVIDSNEPDKTLIAVDYDDLAKLVKMIDILNKSHHIEIAKIFKHNNIKLTGNNNGIFINLNNISSVIIDEIKQYINFIKTQETLINIDESTKENIENDFFKDKLSETAQPDEEYVACQYIKT